MHDCLGENVVPVLANGIGACRVLLHHVMPKRLGDGVRKERVG
jgi:hypothetical protein